MWRLNLYNTNIDFLRWRKLAMGWSIAVLLIAIGSLLIRGMNLGLDFTGGTVIEVQYPESVEIPMVRETLAKAGFGGAAKHDGKDMKFPKGFKEDGKGNEVTIRGLHNCCPGCAKAIEGALKDVEGVEGVGGLRNRESIAEDLADRGRRLGIRLDDGRGGGGRIDRARRDGGPVAVVVRGRRRRTARARTFVDAARIDLQGGPIDPDAVAERRAVCRWRGHLHPIGQLEEAAGRDVDRVVAVLASPDERTRRRPRRRRDEADDRYGIDGRRRREAGVELELPGQRVHDVHVVGGRIAAVHDRDHVLQQIAEGRRVGRGLAERPVGCAGGRQSVRVA